MTEHNWQVWNHEVIEETGYVNRIHWTLDSTDGTRSASISGSINLTGTATIDINIITNQLFVVWAKQILGPEEVSRYEKINESRFL